MSSRYKEQLFNHLKTFERGVGSIISVGGGQEDDRRYFKKLECDEYVIMDSDIRFRPGIHFDLNQPIITPEGDMAVSHEMQEHFDLALVLNLWEYIYDPVTAHENLALLLKSGGELITNYPFVYPMHEPRGTDYLRITPDGYKRLLTKVGFTITSEIPIIGNPGLINFYQEDKMKARKDENHLLIGAIVTAKKI